VEVWLWSGSVTGITSHDLLATASGELLTAKHAKSAKIYSGNSFTIRLIPSVTDFFQFHFLCALRVLRGSVFFLSCQRGGVSRSGAQRNGVDTTALSVLGMGVL